jgi:hypothetical protein
MRLPVLLTATIDPGRMPFVLRRDPALRLRDYGAALERWSRTDRDVVFCENSGWDLSSLERIGAGNPRIEFLQVRADDDPRQGKGRAELRLIRHALEHSATLRNARAFVKLTGRHQLHEEGRFLDALDFDGTDVYVTLRRHLSWADTHLFACTRTFFDREVASREAEVDDLRGVFLEHVFARAVHAAMASGGVWRPFPLTPDVRGVVATNGMQFGNGPLARLRVRLREAARNALLRL